MLRTLADLTLSCEPTRDTRSANADRSSTEI